MTRNTSAVERAAELTAAWLGRPNTHASADEVSAFLRSMYAVLTGLSEASETPSEAVAVPVYTPAVSVRRSLASPDHIVSMIDGRPYRTLRRHLAANGLTPAQYRQRYDLKVDYPMVAPAFSEARRTMAKLRGLPRQPVKAAEPEVELVEGAVPQSVKPGSDVPTRKLGVRS